MRCGCVCLGSGFCCAPPLLAGVSGAVWVCVRAPLVPRLSWLGRAVQMCVLGGFGMRPATPGWGVGVCVCVCVCAPLVPCHSWLGCAVWVCVPGLWFRLRPATPGWGVMVCICLCARSACTSPLLARVCGVVVGVWAPVLAAPLHSWLGRWALCVFVCALRLYPATPGWGLRCRCVFLGSVLGCAPPLLAGMLGCMCVSVRAPLVPRHSWLGCAVCVCVCLGSGVGFAPPLLALVLGYMCVFVCALRLVPCHSRLGRAVGVCVLGLWFQLRCATPGWGFGGCVGVFVRARLVPCLSWLGCAVWVCVLGLRVRLRPASPDGGVGVRVSLCACSVCTPPLLAGVCGVGVCPWALVSAAPGHSWLGCWNVCVFMCALRLYPATPAWGVRCGCVCLGSGFGCAPPLLAGLCGVGVCAWGQGLAAPRQSWLGCWCMCVFVRALRLYPTTPGWGLRCGCVCLGSGLRCALPLLAGMLKCACVCVRAPLVPRHSWLGCAL